MNLSTGEGMNTKAAGTDEAFWDALLDHIVEKGRCTPKFQVERAIGPILGFFLEKAISDLLGREVITLAAEFPLKKPNPNKQSTNIDWLMYDKVKNHLLLVELKTEVASFSRKQLAIYLNLAASESPWKGMENGFKEIYETSKSWKYRFAKDKLDEVLKNKRKRVTGARVRVLYLAPESSRGLFNRALKKFKSDNLKLNLDNDSVEFFSFESLKLRPDEKGDDDLARYRAKLYKALHRLDEDYEDGIDGKILPKASGKNFRARISLGEVLTKCRRNQPVTIGFTGGRVMLKKLDVAHLEKRLYKWDWADERGVGVKDPRNWIDGAKFVEIVETIRATKLRDEAQDQYIASRLSEALMNNSELTLGQLIDRVSRDSALALDDISDNELVEALATPQ